MTSGVVSCVVACAIWLGLAASASAQSRPVARRPAPRVEPSVSVLGFVDLGSTTFRASQSFEAVLGRARGSVFGGGAEVRLPWHLFVNLRASRFRATGERVFVYDGQPYPLGIDTTVTVTPIEMTGGYRYVRPRWRVVPYGGGGVGWHRYSETSEFATADENVAETYTGLHVLGGAEFRMTRWLAAAGEAQWSRVADALGQDPNGVSQLFDESDLGGVTFRIKLVVGR